MKVLNFIKMQGAGNDFVMLDARTERIELSPEQARALADRNFGVGCDLICVMSSCETADIALRFLNADGTEAKACGNASRCVGRLLIPQLGRDRMIALTGRGFLDIRAVGQSSYSVNMGHPELDWADIPLSHAMETSVLPLEGDPGAAGMGNPHLVFTVPDVTTLDIPQLGKPLEHHPLFPERTNVEFCSILNRGHIRMKVWERGVGVTLACGSGACASVVALHRQGKVDRDCIVDLDGGRVEINWRDDGVWMTGGAEHVFEGQIHLENLTR